MVARRLFIVPNSADELPLLLVILNRNANEYDTPEGVPPGLLGVNYKYKYAIQTLPLPSRKSSFISVAFTLDREDTLDHYRREVEEWLSYVGGLVANVYNETLIVRSRKPDWERRGDWLHDRMESTSVLHPQDLQFTDAEFTSAVRNMNANLQISTAAGRLARGRAKYRLW